MQEEQSGDPQCKDSSTENDSENAFSGLSVSNVYLCQSFKVNSLLNSKVSR